MLRGAVQRSLIELVEVRKQNDSYRLVEFYVNPNHIISVEEYWPSDNLCESMNKIGLSDKAKFSTITIKETSGSRELKVVGSARSIYLKLNNNKRILKG
jgi:hypothetical protein